MSLLDGKFCEPYEFGAKIWIAIIARKQLAVGARSFQSNPYDADTLAGQPDQVEIAKGTKPTTASVDLGYSDWEFEGVTVLHQGKPRTMTRQWHDIDTLGTTT